MSGERLVNSEFSGVQNVSWQGVACWSFRLWGEFPDYPLDVLSIAHQDRLTVTNQLVRSCRSA